MCTWAVDLSPVATSRLLPRGPHLPAVKGMARGHLIPHGHSHLVVGMIKAWVSHLWAPRVAQPGPHLHTCVHTPFSVQVQHRTVQNQSPSYLHSKRREVSCLRLNTSQSPSIFSFVWLRKHTNYRRVQKKKIRGTQELMQTAAGQALCALESHRPSPADSNHCGCHLDHHRAKHHGRHE